MKTQTNLKNRTVILTILTAVIFISDVEHVTAPDSQHTYDQ